MENQATSKLAMTQVVKRKSGFGLLEVLIASGIFVMVIGGTTSLARAVLKNNRLSLERTLAYNLAQEGLDLVKEARDNRLLDDDPVTDWNYLKYQGNQLEPLENSDFNNPRTFELFNQVSPVDLGWVIKHNSPDGDNRHGEEYIFIDNNGAIRSNKILNNNRPARPGEIQYIRKIRFSEANNSELEIPNTNGITTAIRVESEVSWNNNENSIVASDVITNWRD